MRQFLKLFGKYIRPYRHYVTGGIIANILSALLNLLAFSLIMPILRILFGMDQTTPVYQALDGINWLRPSEWSVAIDYIVGNFNYYVYQLIQQYGPARTLLLLCIYLVVMTLIKVGVTYGGIYMLVPIRTGVVRDLRNEFNAKLLRLPISMISEERKGDLLARFSGDVAEIEYSIINLLESLIKNPILIIIYLVALFAISWELTLFVLIVLPIAGYVMGAVGKRLKRDSLEGQTQWGRLMSMVEETLSGLRIIKAFNAEQQISHRFTKANEQYRRTISQVYARQGLAHPMSEFLGTTAIAIILWYGGNLIFAGNSSITADAFIYYLVVFYSIINPAKELSRASYSIQKGLASMTRIQTILDYPERITDPAEPLPVTFEQSISYEDVSFRYEEPWVLRNLSLTIPKGQMVALVGASGAGKSTLVDLLPRFYDVTSGRITIDGTDIRQVRASELRELIGYVNQTPILFNDTIRNNITFGMEHPVSDEEIRTAAEAANATEFIDQLPEGFEYNIGDGGSKLSGGQRQRLSIARALLKDSPILILDEATSALDNVSEQLVQEAIQRLVSDRTTIVIAHRLSTIMHADLICVMQEGQIVEQGTHTELLERGGLYAQLYQIQFKE
ncbi:ABC transporter ATP-binding protein [Porphyromonas asaccharolytica]|uniref:Xenobiotic-transporting ATPase n=1 Tax=Porphyromonas asaccharolytica (strain ATCC 25260 / DSM 20707 / BCRC 10618 / CCUG 7834 / JCM 6326 / LMG 13178 / VPI 4198 / B440) TaxID=879243 RepID=F4KJU9_PORAD|nr:ABC transporter ATP-binding protein [Porphyromonas asaccharolytica]AEE12674.1 Xenobiotic-transporting ATPase [Porphyromonas asaccharolytica DSM 20707]